MGRLALAVILGAWLAAPAPAVELLGTWHVLMHFKDSSTPHPERERWDDRIWEVSMEGDRLKWIEYPIVVFHDQSGRFEIGASGRASRVLEFWEPSPGQLAEIRAGLEINTRGSRTKLLRGSSEEGWTSAKRKRGYQSARFITFTETWSIQGMPGAPVFTFDDVMGSASTESFEGRTEYASTSVEDDGNLLRGKFDRDGTRVGTFQMRRAGATSVVKGSGKAAGQRVYEAFFGAELGAALYKGELTEAVSEQDIRGAIDAGDFGEDDRRELRVGFEQQIAEGMEERGLDPRQARSQIQSLARKMTALFVDDGKSFKEIGKMLESGELTP